MPADSLLTPQTTIIRNDGTAAETFAAKISPLTDSVNVWLLSPSANGVDSVRAQWSTTSATGPWTDVAAYDTNFTIDSNVAAGDSINFSLRIQTPTATTSYDEFWTTIAVTATAF